MDKIRNKLNISDSILPETYWDVTKSGKVLELRVRPSIDQAPGKYRLGIIQIGRIISRIQTLAGQAGAQPQIQLFPNLAENQLVATVFWPGFLDNLTSEIAAHPHPSPFTLKQIKQIAEHYGLKLSSGRTDSFEDSDGNTYYVRSITNQPFIWLKLGQFIQELTEQTDISDSRYSLSIEVLTPCAPEQHSSSQMHRYRQAKISVPEETSPDD